MADRVYRPVIVACQTMFKAINLDVRLRGLENLPADGGVVIAINHVSYLDFTFAGLAMWKAHRRYTRFMAKEGVFTHRISGPLMRGMKHIPVDRTAGGSAFRAALLNLKRGEAVGIFPEGTITPSFTVGEMQPGACKLAAAAKVPIVPMAVWGGQRLWTKGRSFSPVRNQTVVVNVGEPMTMTPRENTDDQVAALRTRLQTLLDQAQAEHPATQRPSPQAWWLPAHLGGGAPAAD